MKSLIMKALFGITFLALSGCASSVPVKIDVSTAKELPKDVALNYLTQVGNEKLKTRFFDGNHAHGCAFLKNGVTSKYRLKKGEELVRYDDVVASAEGSSGFTHGATSYAFLYLYTKDSRRIVCPIIADGLNMKNKSDIDKINKIMTAVKSLGVKVEQNK